MPDASTIQARAPRQKNASSSRAIWTCEGLSEFGTSLLAAHPGTELGVRLDGLRYRPTLVDRRPADLEPIIYFFNGTARGPSEAMVF